MLSRLYAKWMFAWETALTTRDTNRIVRPLDWGFDWLPENPPITPVGSIDPETNLDRMIAINKGIVQNADQFFSYQTPNDFRLETRHPRLFPTNVRPETLAQDAGLARKAASGDLPEAEFLRFTSPIRTRYPENDIVNARWYPADPRKQAGKPKQAIIVMPQWNADAFSHNALCTLFNRFGISALRLSKPYHDIRRPAELERSDYAVSSNIGRTIAACQQAVIDIRASIDWLEQQGYTQFGVLGTSLGSCYAFIAAAMDPRIQVCAFNHASTWFGDVIWTGQSTRHIRSAFEHPAPLSHEGHPERTPSERSESMEMPRDLHQPCNPERSGRAAQWEDPQFCHPERSGEAAQSKDLLLDPPVGLTEDQIRSLFTSISPMSYMRRFAANPKRVLVVHATYDLTFLRQFSLDVLRNFDLHNVDYVSKVLPCGHYTTGETPYKYIDGWYLGSFIHSAFKRLAQAPEPKPEAQVPL